MNACAHAHHQLRKRAKPISCKHKMDEHLHMNSTAYNSDEHNTNSNNNNVNGSVIQLRTREIECAFCKRKGDQSTFCGQFCNRVCLGRHSQKKRSENRKQSLFHVSYDEQAMQEQSFIDVDENNNINNHTLKTSHIASDERPATSTTATTSSSSSSSSYILNNNNNNNNDENEIKFNCSLLDNNRILIKQRRIVDITSNELIQPVAHTPVDANDHYNNNNNKNTNDITINHQRSDNQLDRAKSDTLVVVAKSIMQAHKQQQQHHQQQRLDAAAAAKRKSFSLTPLSPIDEKLEEFKKPRIDDANTTHGIDFDWSTFLRKSHALPVPNQFFVNPQPFPAIRNGFKVGMRLEGRNPHQANAICVLRVMQTQGFRIRLRMDDHAHTDTDTSSGGGGGGADFWRNADSRHIFAVGHCERHQLPLRKPFVADFDWSTYLVGKVAAPRHLFFHHIHTHISSSEASEESKSTSAKLAKVGMKLECVDRRNPALIRVATVAFVNQLQLKVAYDGLPSSCDAWFDLDSEDLHPVRWCERTDHPLTVVAATAAAKTQPDATISTSTSVNSSNADTIKSNSKTKTTTTTGSGKRRGRPRKHSLLPAEAKLTKRKYTKRKHLKQVAKAKASSSATTTPALAALTPRLQCIELQKMARQNEIRESVFLNSQSAAAAASAVATATAASQQLKRATDSLAYKYNSRLVWLTNNDKNNNNNSSVKANSELKASTDASATTTKASESSRREKKAKEWNVDEVCQFVANIPGCGHLVETFRREEIDGECLMLIEQHDLIKTMCMKLGPAIKIYNYILKLRHQR